MPEIQKHDLICNKCIEDAGCKPAGTVMSLKGWRKHWHERYPELLRHADAGCIVCGRTDLPVTCVCNVVIEYKEGLL